MVTPSNGKTLSAQEILAKTCIDTLSDEPSDMLSVNNNYDDAAAADNESQ
jgi:hypothetical protein